MLPEQHERAQELADSADRALAAGYPERAESLYSEAAKLETDALSAIPPEHIRTIGVIGLSAASLWYRAANFDKAEEVARSLLGNHDLLPGARLKIEDVVAAIPNAVSVASGGATLELRRQLRETTVAPERQLRALESARDAAVQEREMENKYLAYRTLLLSIATRKFRVPDIDAESILQEVFLSFLQTRERIQNDRAWLVAAVCNASRHYWRSQNRTAEFLNETVYHDELQSVPKGLEWSRSITPKLIAAMASLPPRCREAVWLHYFEGRNVAEVARELETTTRYAEKLLHTCLKRIREIYETLSNTDRAT